MEGANIIVVKAKWEIEIFQKKGKGDTDKIARL
jgi:hypothetical protein